MAPMASPAEPMSAETAARIAHGEMQAAAPTARERRLRAKPAVDPMPAPPPTPRAGRPAQRAQSGDLARNGAVSASLPESGTAASFPFRCDAGELSLFELDCLAFARNVKGRLRLAIDDPSGATVWSEVREAGSQLRAFHAFEAAVTGEHRWSFEVLEGGFRLALVRHSDYAPITGEALDLGEADRVHSHLPDERAEARFLLPVRAGEELAVRLVDTREAARDEQDRVATQMASVVAQMEGRAMMNSMAPQGGARGTPFQFQHFHFELFQSGRSLGEPAPYRRFLPSESGEVEVRVRARYPGAGGGLFDLLVDRDLKPVRVTGVVVDREDRPMPGVELRFLRDPSGDLLARAVTDARGAYEASLLCGDLAVAMVSDGIASRDAVRLHVDSERAVDLMFVPGARLR